MKKVLVIKIGAIGDILMATPALRALKKTYPHIHVSLLVGSSVNEAIAGNSYINELIEIDDHKFFKAGLWQRVNLVWDMIKNLRTENYDTVIILHRDYRYAVFATICGIPNRIGFKMELFGNLFLTKSVGMAGIKHHIYQYLDVVKQCGVISDGTKLDFQVREKFIKRAKRLMQAHNVDNKRLIGIIPGGAQNARLAVDTKRWPIDKYKSLMFLLIKNHFEVMLFGAKTDTYFLKELSLGPKVIDMIGKTSLEETAALMTGCRVIVTPDSGPMHLAAAIGVPIVAIFGPTNPGEYRPLTDGNYVYWKNEGLKCAPCYKDGTFPNCRTRECMQRITPREVYNKVVEIVRRQS